MTYDLLLAQDEESRVRVCRQKPITTYSDVLSVQVSRVDLAKGLLYLVTVDGRPFTALEDEGFKIGFRPILERSNLNYNRKTIATFIHLAADYIRRKLQGVLEKNLVSTKVDAVSRFSRSFLGLNVQVIIDYEIKIFVLGIREITVRHTAENLKDLLIECFSKFNLLPRQIYSITSDNGSNMLKMVKLMDADYRELRYKDIPETNVTDDDEMNELVSSISSKDWADDGIIGVSCIAHTLQLVILDSLKNAWDEEGVDNYILNIQSARKLANNLRKQNNLLLLTARGKCRPSLDVKTRWGSTYTMLDDLLSMEEICNEAVTHGNMDLFLSEETWEGLKEIVQTLKPSYIATKELQEKNLTLPDARKVIQICWLKTAEMGTPLSQELVYNFEKRRSQIMDSPAMLNAIFLDPRHMFELTDVERIGAKKRLLALYKRLTKMQAEEDENSEVKVEPEFDLPESQVSDEDDNLYEQSLAEKFNMVVQENSAEPGTLFEEELLNYEKQYRLHRVDSKVSVLKFWKENQTVFPRLHKVALIVLSGAGTQVSVERLFSGLKFLLNDQRSLLSSENLEDILLIRGNFEYLDNKFFRKVALNTE